MDDGPKAKRPHTSPTNSPHKRLDIFGVLAAFPLPALTINTSARYYNEKSTLLVFIWTMINAAVLAKVNDAIAEHTRSVFLYINKSVIER